MTLGTGSIPGKTQLRTATGRWQSAASGAPAPSPPAAPPDDELLLFAIAWVKDRGLDGADFMSRVAAVFETLKGDIERPNATRAPAKSRSARDRE